MVVHYLHVAAGKILRGVWEALWETARALLLWALLIAAVVVVIGGIVFFIWLTGR